MGVENDIFGLKQGQGQEFPGVPPPPKMSINDVSLSVKAIGLPYVNISVVSQNEIQVKMISSWFDFQINPN